jgi:hypothetical protein
MLRVTNSIQFIEVTKDAPEGFGDFKTGEVICTVKNAGDLVLLAKKGMMLQSMIGRLIEIE